MLVYLMIRKRFVKQQPTRIFVTANRQIRVPQVRVLDEYGEMLGVMTTEEALEKARIAEKDLVLVTENAQPPICKIIDIAKFRYQMQQKKAEGRKKAKTQDIKEVRFTPFMGEADFQSRLKKVVTFLEKGDKVRLSLMFKGRAITKKEFGFDLFQRIFDETKEVGIVESEPKILGKKLLSLLMPAKTKKIAVKQD